MAIGDSAYKVYSQDSRRGEIDAVPRNKYSFTVSLNYIDSPTPLSLVRIANVQIPTYVYRSQTLNAYNAKKTVLTGIDYTPITLTAYDTKDAVLEKFLKDYTAHYVDGPLNNDDYNAFLNNPKGLKTPESRNYIRSIIINRKDTANLENVIEIYNPYITNIDADTLDYGDSSPAIYRITFTYEGFKILSTGMNVAEQEAATRAEEFTNTPTSDDGFADVDNFSEFDVNNEFKDMVVVNGEITSNQAQLEALEDRAKEFQNTGLVNNVNSNTAEQNTDNLQVFKGQLKTGEAIRNINGKSYIVPAPRHPE
jgi:hypothetical protein